MYRWWFGSVPSDEAEAGGDSPTAWGYEMDDLSYTADENLLKALYGSMFNGIDRASEVIEKLPEAREIASDNMKKKKVYLFFRLIRKLHF